MILSIISFIECDESISFSLTFLYIAWDKHTIFGNEKYDEETI